MCRTQYIDCYLHQFLEWNTSLGFGLVLLCPFARCQFLSERCLCNSVDTVEPHCVYEQGQTEQPWFCQVLSCHDRQQQMPHGTENRK